MASAEPETVTQTAPPAATPSPAPLLIAFGVGAAVAILLGVYGRTHDPTGESVLVMFFTSQLQLKVWFATVAVLLAMAQVFGALVLYGKLGDRAPSWAGDAHRLSGTLALLFSLPVAYHCLWSLGFNADAGFERVFIHSLFGCLFYGAFAAKVIVVRVHGLPGWALPVVGSLVFTTLAVLWFTSAYWFFTTFDGAIL